MLASRAGSIETASVQLEGKLEPLIEVLPLYAVTG
jgi:hypothetical protein